MTALAQRNYIGSTADVRPGHAFDHERLAAWLRDAVPGFRGPLDVKQFEGGQSNPTYLLTDATEQRYVLRRKPAGVLLKSAHAVDREFRVMRALAGVQGFPVAQALALCEDEAVIGSMFYVMRHVPGRVFWNCRMPDLQPQERAALYDSANEVLARLHTLDVAALGLQDFGRPGNYFERQIARWSKQYEAASSPVPELDRLIEWLPKAAPQDDGRVALIHGDYSFHNLIVHPREPRVAAVVDWELSTLGHPLADLTYQLMDWYRPEGVDTRGTLQGADLASLGIPSMAQYVARYCERTGVQVPANLAFYRAFNLFRVAAILHGIAARVSEGTAASAQATEVAQRVRPFARAAWAEALEAGAA